MTEYPHLGFDPARGNVGTIRDLAKQITDTGTYAGEAHDAIKAVQDNRRSGPAQRPKRLPDNLVSSPNTWTMLSPRWT